MPNLATIMKYAIVISIVSSALCELTRAQPVFEYYRGTAELVGNKK